MQNLTLEANLYLTGRGVETAAVEMGITSTNYYGIPGLAIPVRDRGGARVRFRAFKRMEGGGKTRWMGRPGKYTPKYYTHPDIKKHIAEQGGRLVIAAGEFDLLTFIMIGWLNVVAFGSENSIPDDLVEQFRDWGTKHVDYWVDNDAAGLRSARRLHDLLDGSGITFNAYSLDGLVDEKGDTNDLWQAVGFDHDRFLEALRRAPLATLPPSEHKPKRPGRSIFKDADEFPRDFVRDVIRVLEGQPQFKQRRGEITCCSPLREDKTPSFNFNTDKLVWCDFGSGESGGIVELGERLGIEIKDYRQRPLLNLPIKVSAAPEPPPPPPPPPEPDDIPDVQIDVPPPELDDVSPLPVFTPDKQVNMRYVAPDVLGQRTLALKSPLNTGKTEAVVRYILENNVERVLFVSHLQALTRNQTERLNAAGVMVNLYSDIPNEYTLGLIDKMVCSLNSLSRLDGAPPYDLVVFDEIEQGIPHLWGGTMKGGEQIRALKTLVNVLSDARQVIALDAHMSDTTAAWLKSIRGDVTRVQNTYRHQWGDLRISLDYGATLEAAQTLADQNEGTVVLTTNSRNEAQMLHRYFTDRYGADVVAAVHGWTSHETATRDLIKDINARLPELRVFICSPSVSTGVDVSVPVAGVFGLFRPQPGAATDLMQQVARFRNADVRMVYITHTERPNLITDPSLLLYQQRYNVALTAQLADFTLYNVTNVTELQGQLTLLWATYEAQRNRQKVDLRGSFVRLAAVEGFNVVWDDTTASATMKATLKAAWKAKHEYDDHMTLTSPAVSPDEMDVLRMAGNLEEAHFYGLQRWKIEHTTGQAIDEVLLEAYSPAQERAALRRFTDYVQDDPELVKQRDRDEVVRLPMDRRHHTANQIIFRDLLFKLFGEAGLNSTEQVPAAELEHRAGQFIIDNLKTLQNLDGRDDLSENVIPAVRRLFKRFHVRLLSKQMRIDGERVQVYYIDHDDLAVKHDRAARRQAYLDNLSTNTETDSYKRVRRQPARYSVKTADEQLIADAKALGMTPEALREQRGIEF
jgi:hypothetical protein